MPRWLWKYPIQNEFLSYGSDSPVFRYSCRHYVKILAVVPTFRINVRADFGREDFEPKILKVITHAWTPKLFFLGDNWLQSIACNLVSRLIKRRQLLSVAVNVEKRS